MTNDKFKIANEKCFLPSLPSLHVHSVAKEGSGGVRLDSRPDFFEGPRRIADITGDNHIGGGTVLTSSIPTLAAA
jgi:hypothetical protein